MQRITSFLRGLFVAPIYKDAAFVACIVAGVVAELIAIYRIDDVSVPVAVINVVLYPICASAMALRGFRSFQLWRQRRARRDGEP